MSGRTRWVLPASVLLLSAVPLSAGALRILQLAGGPEIMTADQRISESPVPIVVHIVAAAIFIVLGVVQFLPASHRGGWHRIAGRVLIIAGLLVAGSALWMTLFYAPKEGTGAILYVSRLVFGSAMVISIVLAYRAIRRLDVDAHRAWTIRAYTLALAAGTQAFTQPLFVVLLGPGVVSSDLSALAGWVLNLAVAEWAIRRRSGRSGRSARSGRSGGSRRIRGFRAAGDTARRLPETAAR